MSYIKQECQLKEAEHIINVFEKEYVSDPKYCLYKNSHTHTHCGTSLMDTVFQNFAEEFGGQESQRQNLKIISIPYYQPDQMGPYMCSTICPKSVLSTNYNIFVV